MVKVNTFIKTVVNTKAILLMAREKAKELSTIKTAISCMKANGNTASVMAKELGTTITAKSRMKANGIRACYTAKELSTITAKSCMKANGITASVMAKAPVFTTDTVKSKPVHCNDD